MPAEPVAAFRQWLAVQVDRDGHLFGEVASARDLIARQGYDPIYGARPLKRVIQRQIENPLAMQILDGNILQGARLSAEVDGERIVFRQV